MTTNLAPIYITRLEQEGIAPDNILAEELSGPGSDLRYGVNIIAAPSPELQVHILLIQQYLKELNPNQYYYPPGDLHLTLLEICSSCPKAEIDDVAATINDHIHAILQDLKPFQLNFPSLVCDNKACALIFESNNSSLLKVREQMIERIGGLGVDYKPRYFPNSAHITFMRYINPLNPDLETWIRYLKLTPVNLNLVWKIESLSISWGATWYGMHSRIKQAGPFELLGTRNFLI
jgi:2'-5' RNA ligase